MQKKHKPRRTPIDAALGGKIRLRRHELGLSQNQLALALGITFQQVQKYETGSNRVSVSRLMDICSVLKVNTAYFLEGLESGASPAPSLTADAGGLKLLKCYNEIPEPKIKRQLLKLAKSLAE